MKIGGFFIALVFALAACSSAPQPREPTATTTPAPAPSSTATAPAMPAQATEDSPEGAAAFVTYWVQVSNYAAATGDVTELARISSPDCTGCQKYIDLYRDTYEAGGYFKGGDWTISDIEFENIGSARKVFAHIDAPAGRQAVKADAEERPTSPENVDLLFEVGRIADRESEVIEIRRSLS